MEILYSMLLGALMCFIVFYFNKYAFYKRYATRKKYAIIFVNKLSYFFPEIRGISRRKDGVILPIFISTIMSYVIIIVICTIPIILHQEKIFSARTYWEYGRNCVYVAVFTDFILLVYIEIKEYFLKKR